MRKKQSRGDSGRFKGYNIRGLWRRYNELYEAKERSLARSGLSMNQPRYTYEQLKELRDARKEDNKSLGMAMVKEMVDRQSYKMSRRQAESIQKALKNTGAGSYSVDYIRRNSGKGSAVYKEHIEVLKDRYKEEYEKALAAFGGNENAARAYSRKVYAQEIFGSP